MNFGWFGWGSEKLDTGELPDIFPLDILKVDFVRGDVISIYTKILTDVLERTHGITDIIQKTLWDNCLKSETKYGLISLLAHAMTDKTNLFLVFDDVTKVLRKATELERQAIEADYAKQAHSTTGIFISFEQYRRTDFVKIYSALEYCAVGSLNKAMNLSKAIQFKISDLRASVSSIDGDAAKKSGQAIARNVGNGKDIIIDAKDMVTTSMADLSAADSASDFINQKRAFYLGLPASYVCGELSSGIGDTGENDTKSTERGLKNYFWSVVKPVIEELFSVSLSYKSQDFRQIDQGLNALKIFEITDDSLISASNKKKIIEGLFDVDEDDNLDTTPPEVAPPAASLAGGAGAQVTPPTKAPANAN